MGVLRLTSPYTTGAAVRRLQEMGDELGVDYGPNDGVFGPQTEAVVKELQRQFGITVDGIYGPATEAALFHALGLSVVPEDGRESDYNGVPVVDMRGHHAPPKNFAHHRMWSQIKGVTLHQTGCMMPDAPKGWRRLNAHVGITSDGKILLVNDATDMIWHAQALSHATIGIEISGNFAGIEGNPRTYWEPGGGPHSLNQQQIVALDALFLMLNEDFSQNGQSFRFAFAHRQSSNMRDSDPGSKVWSMIGQKWIHQLRLDQKLQDEKFGTGQPIPKDWTGPWANGWTTSETFR